MPEKTEKTKAYKCRTSLYREKIHHQPGDIVCLTDEEAERLVDEGVLIPGPEEKKPEPANKKSSKKED